MFGRDIESLLSKFKSHGHFLGVFARGETPHFDIGSIAIFNTLTVDDSNTADSSGSKSKKSGHWLCIARPACGLFEIFDAEPRSTGSFAYLFENYNGSVVLNSVDLMPPGSRMCGEFAVYFVVIRLTNIEVDFTTLLNMYFSLNKENNTRRVQKLLEELSTE